MTENVHHNKWGLYPWSAERGRDLVHQKSFEEFSNLGPRGKVFYCREHVEQYFLLEYGQAVFYVKPDMFMQVPEPKFRIGQKVRKIDSSEVLIVLEVHWHFARNAPFFLMSLDGKRKSKRYFEEDIELVGFQDSPEPDSDSKPAGPSVTI